MSAGLTRGLILVDDAFGSERNTTSLKVEDG